jgi:hypothetical protein
MATNIEKSLDEIIKEGKSKGRPGMRGARRGGRGGNRGGVPRNAAGGGAAGPRRFGLNNSARRQGGSVFKRRSAGGAAGGLNTSMSPKKANAVAAVCVSLRTTSTLSPQYLLSHKNRSNHFNINQFHSFLHSNY